jgi:uncharacterized protein (TIGR03435 family)
MEPHIMSFPAVVALGVAVATAFSAAPQATSTAADNLAAKAPTFDVVSIRPHKDNGNYSHWGTPTPTGYEAYNYQVFDLIFSAYELNYPGQLRGLPQWGYEEPFDVEAKLEGDTLASYRNLSNLDRRRQCALMLRSVMTDRFKLKVHHESRVLPVYRLVIAKGGFKLQQSQGPENLSGMVTNRGLITVRGGPIGARFLVGLSDAVGRIVADETGLTGWYDITLKWAADEESPGAAGPSIFTALQEQLGLRLVPANAPIDVLIVDHVERPSAN